MNFIIRDEKILNNLIEYIRLYPGCSVKVDKKPKRSLPQNRLYWNYINILADHIGIDSEDLHDEMKARVLGYENRIILGTERTVLKRSRDLDKKDFSVLIDAVVMLAHELNVTLPTGYFGD